MLFVNYFFWFCVIIHLNFVVSCFKEPRCRTVELFDVIFCFLNDYRSSNVEKGLCSSLKLSQFCQPPRPRPRVEYFHSNFSNWNFAPYQKLWNNLPVDIIAKNYIREVPNAIFSFVNPTPLKTFKIAGVSKEALALLDFNYKIVETKEFLEAFSGKNILKGTFPLAHRYGGHQFGYWAGQLGDGRAHLLGEYVNRFDDRWELQLKGSGKTPYSRRGDGRAVIRSSVREYLCSEAMHYLGIGTSRAVSLIVSNDTTLRDQFYDGHPVKEKLAVVLRLAKSWFRIGSFEILTINKELLLLKQLADFVIENYFTDISYNNPDKYLIFYSQVVESTAELMAKWQSVGFTHGVCNTDNFSILSITIDYGPFRFMDDYDPGMVPNTSDDEKRYTYEKQPDIGSWNLDKLRIALLPILNNKQKPVMKQILSGYNDLYKKYFMNIFRQKLGLNNLDSLQDMDQQIVALLLKMMEEIKADFTMTFRQLSSWNIDDIGKYFVPDRLWAIHSISKHSHFKQWCAMYHTRLVDLTQDEYLQRVQIMNGTNPMYVLRNWIAENVIKNVEKGDYLLLKTVGDILSKPFVEQTAAEDLGYSSKPPAWAAHIKVSCSS